jgi:hypothetical protein
MSYTPIFIIDHNQLKGAWEEIKMDFDMSLFDEDANENCVTEQLLTLAEDDKPIKFPVGEGFIELITIRFDVSTHAELAKKLLEKYKITYRTQ